LHQLQPEDIENQIFPVARRGYDREKVDAYLRVVAAYYREALRQAQLPQPETSSQAQAFEGVGHQVAAILATAATAAEDLRLDAEREAQRLRAAAAAEAAEMTQAATNQLLIAQQQKAQAQQAAEALRAEVGEEAARIQREARERAAALESEAHLRITRMEEAARLKVDSYLEEGRHRQEMLREAERSAAANLGKVEAILQRAREALTTVESTASSPGLSGDADAPPPPFPPGLSRRERVPNASAGRIHADARSWATDEPSPRSAAPRPRRNRDSGAGDSSAEHLHAHDGPASSAGQA
jgi:DivIVA domain-containing protein